MDEHKSGLTPLGKVVLFLFIVGCLAGGAFMLAQRGGWLPKSWSGTPNDGAQDKKADNGGGLLDFGGEPVTIGIAYGTEKRSWLEWAAQQFADTKVGRKIKVNLLPMGSLEGAQKLLAGDPTINVWSPASALYTETFVQDWKVRQGGEAFVRTEPLALTPMVFVMWKERHDAFVKHYNEVSFRTVGQALAEPTGWAGIAGKPEWGLFTQLLHCNRLQ